MTKQATDFRVWRVGNSVNWNCTVRDIVEETGFSNRTVHNVLKRRGWAAKARPETDNPFTGRQPVDRLIGTWMGVLE